MKTLTTILWVLAALVAANGVLFFWRGIDAMFHYEGLYRLMWFFKMVTYLGIFGLIFYLFRVRQSLLENDLPGAMHQITSMIVVGLLATVFNSLANAGLEIQLHFSGETYVSWADAKGQFWSAVVQQLIDNSLLVYILLASLFILTGFIRLGMQWKSENETFI